MQQARESLVGSYGSYGSGPRLDAVQRLAGKDPEGLRSSSIAENQAPRARGEFARRTRMGAHTWSGPGSGITRAL